MAVNRVRGNAPVPTLALCLPPTLPPPSPALAAEVLAELALRRARPEQISGVVWRLWVQVSRLKREGMERGEAVRIGAWVETPEGAVVLATWLGI